MRSSLCDRAMACVAGVAAPILLMAALACGGGEKAAPSTGTQVQVPVGPPVYMARPAAGKLPFPHHDPAFTQQQVDQMAASITFANTFGGHEGLGDGTGYPWMQVFDWVHPGRDFMLRNGTPIFAIKEGRVCSQTGGGIDIEDADQPGFAWGYGHLVPSVAVGQHVYQGQRIGVVTDEHICLARLMLAPGGDWLNDARGTFQDDFFDLKDTLPPEVDGPLRYFRDASNDEIPRGAMPTLSGKIDVVGKTRDVWGRPATGIAERMGPAAFLLEVLDAQGTLRWSHRANFRTLAFSQPFLAPPERVKYEMALMFKMPILFSADPWIRTGFHYYVITNAPDHPNLAPLTARDEDLHWDTAALDANGARRFPDGPYRLKLTVTDACGNQFSVQDEVMVKN